MPDEGYSRINLMGLPLKCLQHQGRFLFIPGLSQRLSPEENQGVRSDDHSGALRFLRDFHRLMKGQLLHLLLGQPRLAFFFSAGGLHRKGQANLSEQLLSSGRCARKYNLMFHMLSCFFLRYASNPSTCTSGMNTRLSLTSSSSSFAASMASWQNTSWAVTASLPLRSTFS